MRLPNMAHTARPWRIHAVTRDFKLEDVWALPTPGGPDDLDRLVRQFTSDDDSYLSSPVVRALFAIRWKPRGAPRVGQPGLRSRCQNAVAA